MKESALEIITCPHCQGQLVIADAQNGSCDEIENGALKCESCPAIFPIRNYIPRFVGSEHYTVSFGFQWNIHARTQVDKFNGTSISRDRFFSETKWQPQELEGKMILEVGCGSGRFTQIMLDAGATCFSVDYSNAVDACWANNAPHPKLHLFQSDMFHLPFKKDAFDKITCFGVLQHTPLPRKAFLGLVPYLKHGGEIAVDVYGAPISYLHPRHLLRFFTTGMRPVPLYRLLQRIVSRLLPLSVLLRRIPLAGILLSRGIPVPNYKGVLPLNEKALVEWAILDTFDWLATRYDRPQTLANFKEWFTTAGLKNTSFRRSRALYIGNGLKTTGKEGYKGCA